MNLRASALILDGLILVVPVLAADYVLSGLFPHRGFFWTDGGAGFRVGGLGLPGVLMATALSFTYFFLMEATRAQTLGKRYYGLVVQSASGGRASANAISGRTVLRLIDSLPLLYLLGALVAMLTGRRRRRIGDWVAGTVVVREDEAVLAPLWSSAVPVASVGAPPQGTATGMPPMAGSIPPLQGTPTGMPPMAGGIPEGAHAIQPASSAGGDWRIAAYPLVWFAAILLATFGLGLGKAEGAAEDAVALVASYEAARADHNGTLACSMLTAGQQRELVALVTGEYSTASASECPDHVLEARAESSLLAGQLPGFVEAGPRIAYASPNLVVLDSPEYPGLVLMAMRENGVLKLDERAAEEQEFILGCEHDGLLSAVQCGCTFDRLRVEAPLPARPDEITDAWRARAQADAQQCSGSASLFSE